MNVGGIILCGGESKRMGGAKAWLPFGGGAVLRHTGAPICQGVDTLVGWADTAEGTTARPEGVQIVRDEEKGRGPLQGLAAGLAVLEGRVETAYVSSCDVPFLRPAFIQRLIRLLGERAICVPYVGERHHPLAAVYRTEVL